MAYADNLPPGVTLADIPGMFGPDDPTCDCGHAQSEHQSDACMHEEDDRICTCHGFTPEGAY